MIASLQTQLQDVMARSESLAAELDAARADMKLQSTDDPAAHGASMVRVQALEAQLKDLKDDMDRLHAAQAAFALQLKDCCKNDTALAALIAAGVQRHMGEMMGGGSDGTTAAAAGATGATFINWLQSQFVKRDDIDDRVTVLTAKIHEEMKNDAVAAAIAAMATREASSHSETSTVNINAGAATGMTDEHVKHLIREALLVFAADKTGQVDYALESAGGSIISTRCSETYHRHTAQLSLFGIPLWYASNSPRTVIQPDIHPGQCWAFRGQQGYLVIHLTGMVKPTSFSLEHIPKSLSPTGRIDSAPKDFSVLGLVDEQDTQGKVLGNYTYVEEGDPLQFFIVKDPDPGVFSIIELRIQNNHGNEEYTCLYRFRVHGIPQI
jgi:SUN domain-containing protein 1/2